MIDLSAYPAIQTAMFVMIDLSASDSALADPLLFSNYNRPIVIEGETYTGLGTLLSVSDSSSELRTTLGECSIAISGIPNTMIAEFLTRPIRGSNVQVWRGIFDPVTTQLLPITGNPMGRFQGIVNNFGIEEDFSFQDQTATSRIVITATSNQEILSNKVSGRRTNDIDQKLLYPTDTSFDRVNKLSRTNLNWGAPS
jgi:hypothetical protein